MKELDEHCEQFGASRAKVVETATRQFLERAQNYAANITKGDPP